VWTNGLLNGKVTVVYATATRFEGHVRQQQAQRHRHGFPEDGSKEECNWIDDVRQSPCTRITPDGKRIEFRSPQVGRRN
jgi:hypothetical protein